MNLMISDYRMADSYLLPYTFDDYVYTYLAGLAASAALNAFCGLAVNTTTFWVRHIHIL